MDLLDESRTLIHTGKLLRQPETGFEWSGWSELFVLLFDNYSKLSWPMSISYTNTSHSGYDQAQGKGRHHQVQCHPSCECTDYLGYHVLKVKQPIPLDLLTLTSFSDPPTQRTAGLLRGLRGGGGGSAHAESPYSASPNADPGNSADSRAVYPCTIHHNGRVGGLYVLYAETAAIRSEWKSKLEEAIGLRRVVQESNKVFETEVLSSETFLVPSMRPGAVTPAWNGDTMLTGKVTCSIPFNTSDGRALMAIGCAEGVWIGFRHDPRSLRRVLHLKLVTQCAMLEDFGIFLVLADGVCHNTKKSAFNI